MSSRHLHLQLPLFTRLILVWLILPRLIPSLSPGLCSNVICGEKHSWPLLLELYSCCTLSLHPALLSSEHLSPLNIICIHLLTSFRKYLGNTLYVSGTVLSSGDTEKNKIKSLHPLHLCKQALQIQFVSHYIMLLYLFIFFKKRPNPYHQQKAACQVPWLKPTLNIPASI